MKKIVSILAITLSLIWPLSANAEENEYVNIIWQGNKCTAYVTTIYVYTKTTITQTYTCTAWNQIVQARLKAQQNAERARQNAEKAQREARQRAEREAAQAQYDAEQQEKARAILSEIEAIGLKEKIEEVVKQDMEYQYYPDKVTRALNSITEQLYSVDAFYEIFYQLREGNPYRSRFIFNLADAIETTKFHGYGLGTLGKWAYRPITDQCGKKGTVFYNTLEHANDKFRFGVIGMEFGGYISDEEIKTGRVKTCVFE